MTWKPWTFFAVALAGWMNRQQQDVIAYLTVENRILREKLGHKRLILNESQKRRLAIAAIKLGKDLLRQFGTLFSPDTLIRWHRWFVTRKYDSSDRRGKRGPVPTKANMIRKLVLEMAAANPSWGYGQIHGELKGLGYKVSWQTVRRVVLDHGLLPDPDRPYKTTWNDFIKSHWESLVPPIMHHLLYGETWSMKFPVLVTLLLCLANPALSEPHRFHADHVLGTSLDLTVVCEKPADAQAAYRAVIQEVERLRRIVSTYDPASDISRLQRATSPATYPRELVEVLEACTLWRNRSQGAFSPQTGPLIALWQDAQKQNRLPDEAALARAVRDIAQPAYMMGDEPGVILRRGGAPINVDALAKGYIIDKALAATRTIPAVQGALLDIGGELAAWGKSPDGDAWPVGVADPAHPQDNAPTLARLRLGDRAVATSGAYARYYTVAGRRYSHILDPRTGMPAEQAASATVVAANCADADALATTLCVLPPEQGLRLVESMRSQGADAACLLILPDGRQLASAGWADLAEPMAQAETTAKSAWPNGYTFTIAITIAPQTGRKTHRPYVATWITNAKGDAVRTIQVWGRERKYLRDLPKWWAFAQRDRDMVRAVTRASRSPGRYELVWDGLDDKGKPVPAGTYTVYVESNREKGSHVVMSGKIECRDKPASARLDGNREIQSVEVNFGPQGNNP